MKKILLVSVVALAAAIVYATWTSQAEQPLAESETAPTVAQLSASVTVEPNDFWGGVGAFQREMRTLQAEQQYAEQSQAIGL